VAADWLSLLGFGGTFTVSVSGPTNAVALVNSDGGSRRGSKHGCRSNSVPTAERGTAKRGLTARQKYPVKLHNRIGIANRQRIAVQAPGVRLEPHVSGPAKRRVEI
jgi:hypothetical protein